MDDVIIDWTFQNMQSKKMGCTVQWVLVLHPDNIRYSFLYRMAKLHNIIRSKILKIGTSVKENIGGRKVGSSFAGHS